MKKDFDCVEMKREGAARVRELTKGMSRQQILDFWAKRTQRLRESVREKDEQKRSA
jgi:hypothetical protein